jgi:hypothetical protein
MYSMPDLTMRGAALAGFTCDAKMLPKVESSWPGTTIGRFAAPRRAASTLGIALVASGSFWTSS